MGDFGAPWRQQVAQRSVSMMLFEQRFWAGLADGTVTTTFRRWKKRQVVAGNRYRTPAGRLEVESVDIVEPSAITDDEARRSGYPSAAVLLDDLRGQDDLPLYRVRFHHVDEPDERDVLAAQDAMTEADLADLDRQLDRLDRASSHGPWTRATLRLIAEHPAVRAGDLAELAGRELQPFKLDVRKLKNLGLTLSLDIGYRLSARGEAYLRHLA
jgi:hypothetical protein